MLTGVVSEESSGAGEVLPGESGVPLVVAVEHFVERLREVDAVDDIGISFEDVDGHLESAVGPVDEGVVELLALREHHLFALRVQLFIRSPVLVFVPLVLVQKVRVVVVKLGKNQPSTILELL